MKLGAECNIQHCLLLISDSACSDETVRFTYPGGMEGWVDVPWLRPGRESKQRPLDRKSDAQTVAQPRLCISNYLKSRWQCYYFITYQWFKNFTLCMWWTISGRTINNLRYADDIVLIATSQEALQRLMNKLSSLLYRASMGWRSTQRKPKYWWPRPRQLQLKSHATRFS